MPLDKIIENSIHYILLLENNDSQERIKGSEKYSCKKKNCAVFKCLHLFTPRALTSIPVSIPKKQYVFQLWIA